MTPTRVPITSRSGPHLGDGAPLALEELGVGALDELGLVVARLVVLAAVAVACTDRPLGLVRLWHCERARERGTRMSGGKRQQLGSS